MSLFNSFILSGRLLQFAHLRWLLVLMLVLGFAPMGWANSDVLAGRVAAVAGGAWLFDSETQQWAPLAPNQAVTQGDQLRTDGQGRVTLHLGSISAWLDEASELEVLQFTEEQTLLKLSKGDLGLRVRMAESANETRVQTREGVISTESEGLYRIGQQERGTRLAVLQGRARFDSDPARAPQRAWLREGEQSSFGVVQAANADNQPVSVDRFYAWLVAQDRLENEGIVSSAVAVMPPVALGVPVEQRGHWEQVDLYGRIWIPYHPYRPWVPYRLGHWVPWRGHWAWAPRPQVVPRPSPRLREHYFEPNRPHHQIARPPAFNPPHREHPREERRSREDPKPQLSPNQRPEPAPVVRDPMPPRQPERSQPIPRPQTDEPPTRRANPEGKNRDHRERTMER